MRKVFEKLVELFKDFFNFKNTMIEIDFYIKDVLTLYMNLHNATISPLGNQGYNVMNYKISYIEDQTEINFGVEYFGDSIEIIFSGTNIKNLETLSTRLVGIANNIYPNKSAIAQKFKEYENSSKG